MNHRYQIYVEGFVRDGAVDVIDTATLGEVAFILANQPRDSIKKVYEVTTSFDIVVRRQQISVRRAWEKIREGLQ